MFSQNSLYQWRQLGLVSFLALVGALAQGNDCAKAQIVPDNTLGNERSVVTPFAPNSPIDQINGGARRGTNLFHSFEQFNVNAGRGALFRPDSGIENIISRVTGGSRSEIFGRLGVLGRANLFLINPNGIIFGPNATLAIGGSFVATTANAIQFGDQGFFSASAPDAPPLLVVKPSALLFNQIPKSITYQSKEGLSTERLPGLQLPSNRSLLLVGGDVNLEGGRLQTQGGRIELGGLAGAGTVGLNVDSNNLRLSFPQSVQKADVSLTNGARLDVSSPRGSGSIQVHGRRVTLANGSQILTNTLGTQPGEGLTVTASELVEVIGGSRLLAETQGAGTGGNLTIETGKLIIRDGSQVAAGAFNSGPGGTVTVRASDSVELSGTSGDGYTASRVFTQTEGTGNAGSVNIETGKLIVQGGALVSTAATSSGQGGTLVVRASDSVQLIGTSTSADNPRPSGLFALGEGSGKPGDLTIETRDLIVRDGARASASNQGSSQQGGTLTVNASESVQLIGTSANGQDRSGLLVGTAGTGAAGELTIETGKLLVSDGAFVSARTVGEGRGGSIIVKAEKFNILNGAEVTVGSLGSGDAGNLEVIADFINLDKQSSLTANSVAGEGGNINLLVRDILLLTRNSNIFAVSGTAQAGGAGGNFFLNSKFIVALENSDIVTNAFTGTGGNIAINSQSIFGTEFRQQQTQESDIVASGAIAFSGIINVDQSLGFVELPTVLADTLDVIDTSCAAVASTDSDTQKNKFTITGRGGLPPSPYEPLTTDVLWSDNRIPNIASQQRSEKPSTKPPTKDDVVKILPATAWVFDGKGNVTLISHASNVNNLGSTPACQKK
jgi:filamentous hemagglutinin family protein